MDIIRRNNKKIKKFLTNSVKNKYNTPACVIWAFCAHYLTDENDTPGNVCLNVLKGVFLCLQSIN